MEELTSTVQQNAENATEASKLSVSVMDYLTEVMVKNVEENICDNDIIRLKNRVIAKIRELAKTNKYPGASGRELKRTILRVFDDDRKPQAFLNGMIAAGEIGKTTYKPSRGPHKEYYYVGKKNP